MPTHNQSPAVRCVEQALPPQRPSARAGRAAPAGGAPEGGADGLLRGAELHAAAGLGRGAAPGPGRPRGLAARRPRRRRRGRWPGRRRQAVPRLLDGAGPQVVGAGAGEAVSALMQLGRRVLRDQHCRRRRLGGRRRRGPPLARLGGGRCRGLLLGGADARAPQAVVVAGCGRGGGEGRGPPAAPPLPPPWSPLMESWWPRRWVGPPRPASPY